MSESNRVPSEGDNLVTSLKIGVFITVLGWMVLAVEASQLAAAPSDTATTPQAAVPALSLMAVDYFPARFPAPKGEAEALPATF